MNLLTPSFQKWLLCVVVVVVNTVFATPPRFSVPDTILAEWQRQPLSFSESTIAALPAPDRARLDRVLARIGALNAPALLPPELEKPTLEAWEAKAKVARSPQARFAAPCFLNRLKSPRAMSALEGLKPADTVTWPKHLCLDAGVATARLNGSEVSPGLRGFLEALPKADKVEPLRAQAARLRLLMAGKEAALLQPVQATPGSLLAVMDAWNRSPWAQRRDLALDAFKALSPQSAAWGVMELQPPAPAILDQAWVGMLSRLAAGIPKPAPVEAFQVSGGPWPRGTHPLAQGYGYQALAKVETPLPALLAESPLGASSPLMLVGTLLPALRRQVPEHADQVRSRLLAGSDMNEGGPPGRSAPNAAPHFTGKYTHVGKVEDPERALKLLNDLELGAEIASIRGLSR